MPDGWSSGFAGYLSMSTVTFDANNGTGATEALSLLPGCSALPVDCGFSNSPKFLTEWNTKADGSGDSFVPGTGIYVSGVNTLYAIWEIIHVTDVKLSSTAEMMNVGDTASITATLKPVEVSYPAVTWQSSNAAVAAVDQTGLVTAKGQGSATITATADGKSATCAVTVILPVAGIYLDKTSMILAVGASDSITAAITPSDATDQSVVWTSDTPAVATVNAVGKVTAVSAGGAVITATCSGYTATCKITVTGVCLNISLNAGGTAALVATASAGGSALSASWKSSNTGVATVNASGVITAVGEGSAVITFTSNGVSQAVGVLVSAKTADTGSENEEASAASDTDTTSEDEDDTETYTAEASAAATATSTPRASESTQPSMTASATSTATPDGGADVSVSDTPDLGGGLFATLLWIIGGLLVAAGAGAAVVIILKKKTRVLIFP